MIRIITKTFHKNRKPINYISCFFKKYSNVAGATNDYFQIPIERIRNFSIIAHVDHGKSTLCDRLLEITGAISKDSINRQVLDSLQVEKERGITVKAQTVSLLYKYKDQQYLLNLIDTPGHVDFSNEVARSLSICDGVVLLVDACQGVQAQTVANYYLAKNKNLVVVPIINKIDLKHAKPERVSKELEALCRIDGKNISKISAKLGTGVENVLNQVIEQIPAPCVDRMKDFRGLVFDSWYDRYKGTLNLTYVRDGKIEIGDEIQSYSTGKIYPVKTISILKPEEVLVGKLFYWNRQRNYAMPTSLSCIVAAKTNNASFIQQIRNYAKSKDKGKEKKKKPGKVEINEALINEFIDLDKYNGQMSQILDQMKDDFIKNISLRSSIGSIESLKVTVDGTEHEIQEIAQIGRKGTKTVIINMGAFPQYIPDVLKTINNCGMNLNPQQEGTTLYVPVPKVSREHREQLSKNAKSLFVKCRVSIRQLQNDAIKKLKKQEKISQDDSFSIQNQLTAIGDRFVSEAENILAGFNNVYLDKNQTAFKPIPIKSNVSHKLLEKNFLLAGQVGLISCNMKNSQEISIGETVFLRDNKSKITPLEKFKALQPMVFAGIYPADQSKHVLLRSAIEKLILNDSAVTLTTESSPALGQGWRLGFLGLLHMEVFCQRLEQEHDAESIITAPTVTYRVKLRNPKLIKSRGTDLIEISNASLFPNPIDVSEYFEPLVKGTIITPSEYLGKIISLCVDRRGVQEESINIDDNRILMKYVLPLSEIIVDFNDKLKSISSGYASFNYENQGYHSTNIVKLDVHLNGKPMEEFCRIVHCTKAKTIAREMAAKLQDLIPRQMVQIAIQVCVGSKVLARETIKPYRKDVTAKLYGGDVTRRKKLLAQQAEGKKKMRMVANIRVPHEAFINILKR